MRKSYADAVGPDDVGAGDNAVAEVELEDYYYCCWKSDDCGFDGREDYASWRRAMKDAGESG